MPSRVNKNTKFLFYQNFRHNSVCHHQWQENEKKREDRDTQRVEEGEAENRTEQDPSLTTYQLHHCNAFNTGSQISVIR